MLSGERKKFALGSARKPMLVDGLSNTVIVYEDGEPRFCYVVFDPCFVAVVGKELPRGVSANDPAFVQVLFDRWQGKWVISACYVSDWEQRVLWMADEKPSWVKELKPIRQNNEHNCPPLAPTSAEQSNPGSLSGRRIRSRLYASA